MAIFPGSAIPSAVSDYEIDNSLRFNYADSAYLSRTVGTATSNRTGTFSWWEKGRIENSGNDNGAIFSNYTDSNNRTYISHSGALRQMYGKISGSANISLNSDASYRDPAAWYHMVVTVDVTQATEADRVKWYTNGEQITIASGSTYPAQNVDLPLFSGTNVTVGAAYTTSVNVFSDWALAEFYYIDGTALTPSTFGELSSTTNQWKPLDSDDVKDAVEFGTNGFFQKYNSTELAASFADSHSARTSATHTVSANGNVHTDTSVKKFGTASAQFDGSGDYLSIPASSSWDMGTSNWTWECWIRLSNVTDQMGILISGDEADDGWRVLSFHPTTGINSYRDFANGENDLSINQGSMTLSADTWYHIALVRSDTTVTAYLAGSQVAQATSITGSFDSGSSTNIVTIGAQYNNAGTREEYLTGYVDEVRVSSTARYTGSTYTVPTSAFTADADTLLLLHMDGADSGTSFYDDGPHTITANGDATNQRPQHHNVTATGDAHLIGPKVGTSVFHANSSGDYIGVPSSSDWAWGTGDFTVEGWFNVKEGGHNELMNCGGEDWRFAVESNGKPSWNHSGSGAELTSSTTVASNTWFHLAVSRSSGTSKMFLDGVEVDSASDTHSYVADALTIGSYSTGSYGMDGYAEQIRISDVARYTSAFTPSTNVLTNDSDTQLLITNGTDGTQTFDDLSTSDHTLTANGDIRWFAPKIGAGAMATDGSDHFLVTGDRIGSGDWTVEFWFQKNDSTTSKYFWDMRNSSFPHGGSPAAPYLYFDASASAVTGLNCGMSDGSSTSIASLSISNNAWHHIATTRSGSTYTVWVDGTSVHTATDSAAVSGSEEWYIGERYSDADGFAGYMDGFRISSVARYTGTFTPPTTAFTDDINTNLILNADLNQGTWNPDTSTGLAISTDSRIKFGSGGNYLKIADPEFPAMSNWTFETWIRFEDDPATSAVNTEWGWGTDVSSANVIKFAIQHNGSNYGSIRFIGYLDSGSNAFKRFETTGTTPLHQGQWHHIVWSQAGSTDYIFVDGVSQSVTRSEVPGFNLVDGDWGINGLGPTGFSYNEECQIDEVRLSNVTRYTSNFTPATRGNPFTADANTLLLIHSDYTGGLGADSSGNFNNFTATNLVATDQVLDTPTNNFCTWNPIDIFAANLAGVVSEGNLKIVDSTNHIAYRGTFGLSSGKWYWEIYMIAVGSGANSRTGICKTNTWGSSSGTGPVDMGVAWTYDGDGQKTIPGSTGAYGATYTAGDIVGVALDMDAGTITFYKNNATQGQMASGITDEVSPLVAEGNSDVQFDSIANFGQDSSFAGVKTAQGNQDGNDKGDFYYAPPSGHLALCTDNLSTPEIALPEENFNTVIYTGDGAVSHAITGVGFQPDMNWVKARSFTKDHNLVDSVRGAHFRLVTNGTNAQNEDAEKIISLDSDGFTTGVDGATNDNTETYVAWNWKAGTTNSGATSGSGTLKTYSSSTDATSGFSVIKYVGNGTSGHQIPHHMGVAPQCLIAKNLDRGSGAGSDWHVWHTGFGTQDKYIWLNQTNPAYASSNYFTAVSSTTFSLGTDTSVNADGEDIVCYAFTGIDSYSKFGSYEGNGDDDGSFIYLGFRPSWFLCKNIDSTEGWEVWDNKRDPYNVTSIKLSPNTGDADYTANETTYAIDFVSNGVKLRTDYSAVNESNTFIYMAFAKSPFKYSNAR